MPTPPDPIDSIVEDPKYSPMIQRIRHFMRDYEELNRLIAGVESKDRDIAAALLFTIDDINMTPPPLQFSLPQMLQYNWSGLIVLGATIHVLRSLTLHYIRNNLSFNDGGMMTAGLSDRAPSG